MNEPYEVFIGRLGQDPDLRYHPKHGVVCYLSVAIKQDQSERPIWKRVLVWGRQAELCPLYLKKGYEVFVQGQIQYKEFTDRNGIQQRNEQIRARLVGFLCI